MPDYAKGRLAYGLCQRCGLRYLLRELVLDGYYPNIRVCTGCYDPPQPQERLAVVSDPVALWKPATDTYLVPPPFLTATVMGGQVILNWTSIMAPAVGNDVGGRHHGPYLSAGYEVWRAAGQSTAQIDATLLLHMDNGAGSTVFTDSSVNNLPITMSSAVQQSIVQERFGPSSALFSGGHLSTPIAVGGLLDLGSGGDLTIEGWTYAGPQSGSEGLVLLFGNGAVAPIFMLYNTGSNQYVGSMFGSGALNSPSNTAVQNAWNHFAIVVANNVATFYCNGIGGTPATITETSIGGAGWFLSFGGSSFGDPPYSGYLDEVRIIKGYAAYTANFTPPTAPFTPIVVPGQMANQFGIIASFTNTADEFGALSVETLTYTDPTPPTPNALYYIRGYDTHENAENG